MGSLLLVCIPAPLPFGALRQELRENQKNSLTGRRWAGGEGCAGSVGQRAHVAAHPLAWGVCHMSCRLQGDGVSPQRVLDRLWPFCGGVAPGMGPSFPADAWPFCGPLSCPAPHPRQVPPLLLLPCGLLVRKRELLQDPCFLPLWTVSSSYCDSTHCTEKWRKPCPQIPLSICHADSVTSVTELLFPPEESVCTCGGETEPSFPRLHHWFALAVPSHSGSHPLTRSSQNPHLCASRPVSHVVCTRDKSRGVPEATGSASPSSGTGESRLPALGIPGPPRGSLPFLFPTDSSVGRKKLPRPDLGLQVTLRVRRVNMCSCHSVTILGAAEPMVVQGWDLVSLLLTCCCGSWVL